MRKKILFAVNDKPTLSGGQTMVLNILREMNRDTFEPILTVQTVCPLSELAESIGVQVVYRKHPSIFIKSQTVKNKLLKKVMVIISGMLTSKSYSDIFKRENYDFIWCENFSMFLLCSSFRKTDKKLIYNMWSNVNSKFGLKLIHKYSDYIVVEADFQLKRFEKIGRSTLIKKITTQIDPEIITEHYTPDEAKAKLGVTDDQVLIGFLGGARYSKGYDIFLNVAYELIKNRKKNNYIFIIAGIQESDDMLNNFTCMAKLQEIKDSVILKQWIAEKELFYRSLSLFISTSRSEGLPGTVREAMAFGVPVIGSNVGGTGEILDNLDLLIDINNKDDLIMELADKISRVVENSNSRSIYSDTLLLRSMDLYVGKSWIRELEGLLESLAD